MPRSGWTAWNAQSQCLQVFSDDAWTDLEGGVPDTLGMLGMLGINTVASSGARLSVKSDSAVSSHDDVRPGTGDMRLQVSRESALGTASLIFLNDDSERAELGLIAYDHFRIRLSEDGASWDDCLVIEPVTFRVRLNHFLGLGCTVPTDFWSAHQTGAALLQPYGYIGTNGSFVYGLWYNGYRNSSGGGTALGVNGSNFGVAVELLESGFHVRHEMA